MKQPLLISIILFLLVGSAAFSVYRFLEVGPHGLTRRTFVYRYTGERPDNKFHSKYNCEARYLATKGRVKGYIDDLLLGPITEHCKPIFDTKTTYTKCDLVGDTLAVDLSLEAYNLADKDARAKRKDIEAREKEAAQKASLEQSIANQGNLPQSGDVPQSDTLIQSGAAASEKGEADLVVIAEEERQRSLRESINLFEANITRNFPDIKTVKTTIDGKEPFAKEE